MEARRPTQPLLDERTLRVVLLAIGAFHIFLGGWQFLAPGSFFEHVGRYGAENTHYVGDVGLLATKVAYGDDMIEGYHLLVGGGVGDDQHLARQELRDVPPADVAPALERILRAYVDGRREEGESFPQFTRRHTVEQLRGFMSPAAATA